MKSEHFEIQQLGLKTNRWHHYSHLGIFFTAEEARRVLDAHRFQAYKPNRIDTFDLNLVEFRIVQVCVETTIIQETE